VETSFEVYKIMIRLLLLITLVFISVQVGGVVQKKYLPEGLFENAVDKVVEIGGDTVDALHLVYEMHKPVEED
tara:strand:- start:572 stop:790 length:219 start_codon:yes stop_codon:yes gene_type:complete